MSQPLPMMTPRSADAAVVWRRGGALSVRELLLRAGAAANALPAHRYYLNACERRSTFLIAFLAALQRGAITLLPASRSDGALADLTRQFPDQMTLTDASIEEYASATRGAEADVPADTEPGRARVPADQVAAIVFTSGSTGTPLGHAKRWSTLLDTAALARERLLDPIGACNLVTTVPAQHMYGLETGILLTLGGGCAVSDERPFFPRDITEELSRVPEPRALVTTPAHLRACVAARAQLPPLALILSATAPLSRELAAEAEALSGAPVHEIYGCSETGSMASRRTIEGDLWQPFRGSHVEIVGGQATYSGEHLPAAVVLQDIIEQAPGGAFRLVGRSADLVKIAGKRASLADLTQQLLAVAGVADAVVFMPSEDGRCAALAVAPHCTREQVLAALATRIDSAFLPRPLKLVARLPRNDAGKLPRAALLAALVES